MSHRYTSAVNALLQKIIDATNKWGVQTNAPFTPLLGFDNVLDCLYRGHADMPTKLRHVSEEGQRALEKFKTEIGHSKKEWALSDETAVWVLHMIFTDGIELVFQA
jgi:hypothetical protein